MFKQRSSSHCHNIYKHCSVSALMLLKHFGSNAGPAVQFAAVILRMASFSSLFSAVNKCFIKTLVLGQVLRLYVRQIVTVHILKDLYMSTFLKLLNKNICYCTRESRDGCSKVCSNAQWLHFEALGFIIPCFRILNSYWI